MINQEVLGEEAHVGIGGERLAFVVGASSAQIGGNDALPWVLPAINAPQHNLRDPVCTMHAAPPHLALTKRRKPKAALQCRFTTFNTTCLVNQRIWPPVDALPRRGCPARDEVRGSPRTRKRLAAPIPKEDRSKSRHRSQPPERPTRYSHDPHRGKLHAIFVSSHAPHSGHPADQIQDCWAELHALRLLHSLGRPLFFLGGINAQIRADVTPGTSGHVTDKQTLASDCPEPPVSTNCQSDLGETAITRQNYHGCMSDKIRQHI